MKKMRKKVINSTLAATLVLTSAGAVLSSASQTAYANTTTTSTATDNQEIQKIVDFYNQAFPTDAAKTDANNFRYDLKNYIEANVNNSSVTDQWYQLSDGRNAYDIVNAKLQSAHITNPDHSSMTLNDCILDLLPILVPNGQTFATDVQTVRTTYSSEFDTLFGSSVTVDGTLIPFVSAVDTELKNPYTWGKALTSSNVDSSLVDTVVQTAVNDVLQTSPFKNTLDGELSKGLGISMSDIIQIRKNILNAFVSADSKYANDYKIVKNDLIAAAITHVGSFPSGGGGGGSVTPPTTTTTTTTTTPSGSTGTPVDVSSQATVSTSTDANGNTVTTATLDTATILSALTDASAKQITIQVGNSTSNAVQASLPADAILQVASKSADSSLTVASTLGTLNVPVKVLSTLNTDTIAQALGISASDVDLSKAQVNVEITKAPSNVATAVDSTVQQNGASVLVPAVDFSISVSVNGKSVELSSFGSTYVARSFPLPSTATTDSSHIVGARVVTTTAPDGTVHATLYPVPTIVQDGTVTLKRPGDSTYTVVQTNKTFSDINSSWAQTQIGTLANKLVFNGYSDGTYRPQADITRAELATTLVRALGLTTDSANAPFSDVKAGDWDNAYVAAAAKAGIVKGYTDGTFAPNSLVTRQEAATMIANAVNFLGLKPSGTAQAFTDNLAISSWASNSVNTVSELGIIKGYPNGSFQPAANANRAEIATMVLNLMKQGNLIN